MEMLTKGYQWYHDTPEHPFKETFGSIWLINPETEKWMLELQKDGHLWYYYETPVIFSMYLNMEVSDFKSFIKIWVKDVLKRGVVSTVRRVGPVQSVVEYTLKRGVVSTCGNRCGMERTVEDALKNGKQWN